jgi:hypothetical protein
MDYEFTAEENKVIAGIVVSARVAAVSIGATGVWKGAMAIRAGQVGGVVIAVCMFALVALLWRASAAFDRVVKTEGADKENLVSAFDELRKIFRGLRNVQLLLLALIPIGILGSLVVAATHATHP